MTGTITSDETFEAANEYVLGEMVFVGNDVDPVTLTIEAGTVIYGESAVLSALVVQRNAKILAEGTATDPIVFTSAKLEGERARGDWGGLILNGNANGNKCDQADLDSCSIEGEVGSGYYGGSDDSDDSGVLKYVRVEFAGNLADPENELNGIAFQGVGSGTTIDYIQVPQELG